MSPSENQVPSLAPLSEQTLGEPLQKRKVPPSEHQKSNLAPVSDQPVDDPQPRKRKAPSSKHRKSNISPASEQTIDEPRHKKRKTPPSDHQKSNLAPVANLLIKRHSDTATIPTRGSALAAGYDLYSAEDKLIPAHSKALIDTQISIAVPVGTYGRVAPRSGLATKFMIDTGAGVVDADYRGIIFVLLFNLSDKDFEVKRGDRIAQLIIERIYTPEVLEVQELDNTLRGAGGFGSTGGHVLL